MKIFIFFSIFMLSILVHEFGHYYAGIKFKVRTLAFVIGVGPTLYETYLNETNFNIKLFPLMGLIEHDEYDINRLSLIKNIIILIAGPLNNLFLGMSALLVLCKFNFMLMLKILFLDLLPSIISVFSNIENFIGTNSTITTTYSSIPITNLNHVWSLIVIVNIGLAFGNLIPVPALDGGQIILFILQRMLENLGLKRAVFNKIVSPIIGFSFIVLLFLPLINEIFATKKPLLYCIYSFIGLLLAILIYVISKTELYRKLFKTHN